MRCASGAGSYELSIKDARSKEALPGSPFAVEVEAGPPVASHSSARFGAGVDSAAVAGAGAALSVLTSLRDRFGNATAEGARSIATTRIQMRLTAAPAVIHLFLPIKEQCRNALVHFSACRARGLHGCVSELAWRGSTDGRRLRGADHGVEAVQSVAVVGVSSGAEAVVRFWAAGPADVEFERAGVSEYVALLTAAGTYTLKGTLNGSMLPGQPSAPPPPCPSKSPSTLCLIETSTLHPP